MDPDLEETYGRVITDPQELSLIHRQYIADRWCETFGASKTPSSGTRAMHCNQAYEDLVAEALRHDDPTQMAGDADFWATTLREVPSALFDRKEGWGTSSKALRRHVDWMIEYGYLVPRPDRLFRLAHLERLSELLAIGNAVLDEDDSQFESEPLCLSLWEKHIAAGPSGSFVEKQFQDYRDDCAKNHPEDDPVDFANFVFICEWLDYCGDLAQTWRYLRPPAEQSLDDKILAAHRTSHPPAKLPGLP
jgi:hypothetical protein